MTLKHTRDFPMIHSTPVGTPGYRKRVTWLIISETVSGDKHEDVLSAVSVIDAINQIGQDRPFARIVSVSRK